MLRSPNSDDDHSELLQLRGAIQASGDVVYDWDLANDELRWLGAADRLFGADGSDLPLTGDALLKRINPEDMPCRAAALANHLAGEGEYDCEYRIRDADGTFHWVHDRGAGSHTVTGSPARMVGVLRLVTQRKQHEAKLEYLANFDDLTGHFNKLRLRQTLDHALARSLRSSRESAFLVVGLDQIGRINAAYGHEAGDRVLFDVSQRFDGILRSADVVGRLDSDRFGVVISDCDAELARNAAERVLQAVRQAPVEIGGRHVHVTASIGVVFFPTHAQTSFDIITKAEGALLRAKAAGRDCLSIYEMTEQQRRDQLAHMNIAEEVKWAVKENRLTFAYQPVVDAVSEKVRFYECLLRMRMPGGALVPAERFVPVIEQLGLIRTIDRKALELAIRDLEAHEEITLALNISGITAADHSWLRALTARLSDRPDLARRLIVEITETAALQDIEESADFVSAVRNLGCRVAVDDFGAGYTTFRHLKALTVDIVKIDGSFIRDIGNSAENQLFIESLLSLARTFGLVTVAECVERASDADYLRSQGVDLLQGYHFGRPRVDPPWRGPDEQGAVVQVADALAPHHVGPSAINETAG